MRRTLAMIRIEFLREFSSPMSLVFFLILPVLFTAAISTGFGDMMEGAPKPEERRIPIYVTQTDTGPLVDALLAALSAAKLDPQLVATLPLDEFGLAIPANFSAALLAGDNITLTLHTRPETQDSTIVEQAVKAAQGRVGGAALTARMGTDQARRNHYFKSPAEENPFFQKILLDTLTATQEPRATTHLTWPTGGVVQDPATAMVSGNQQASA